MTVFDIPGAATEIHKWFLEHPNLLNDWGPWALIVGGLGSLLFIHIWPWFYRQINPLEFYLEPDIKTGVHGLQSFPNGPTIIQVRVKTKVRLSDCRVWILRIEYKPDGGDFKDEHNERFPCQWSWPGTQDHSVIDMSTTVPCAFNVATVANGVWGFEPIMPTNIQRLIQRQGTHRFTLNVTGHHSGREKYLTKALTVDWRGATQNPVPKLE
jgi:hypothetical protein